MIYLDSGATTLEKPPAVARAMAQAVGEMSSPGRGNYPASQKAARTAYDCREAAAELFHVPAPEQVIFTCNATHGLNIAIRTLVRPGCRVAVSGYEHNAVTRVLHSIPGVEIMVADAPLFRPEQTLEGFRTALRRGVDAVICNHVSNVFGCVQPVEELAGLCRRTHTPLIVDASQSAGILPVLLADWGAAFVAMPGHKGLYGPQGTGRRGSKSAALRRHRERLPQANYAYRSAGPAGGGDAQHAGHCGTTGGAPVCQPCRGGADCPMGEAADTAGRGRVGSAAGCGGLCG